MEPSTPTTPCLLVQAFLREWGAEALVSQYNLIYRRHSEYDNLCLFKYKQMNSPLHEPIVQECRGIILDEKENWKVVCMPYKKFFNFGEDCAADIDWSTATVTDKVDGSLISLYWYGDKWNIASSGIPDGAAKLHETEFVFSDLFWSIWNKKGYELPSDTTKCYMFEMITPSHVIVVRPEADEVYLHGVRDLTTLEEVQPGPIAEEYGWPLVQSFSYSSIEEVQEKARHLDPIKAEGFVVCDGNWNRVKVKVRRKRSIYDTKGMNLQNMVEIVRLNEGSEFLSYFPAYRMLYEEAKRAYETVIAKIQADYDRTAQIINSKFPNGTATVADFDNQFKRIAEVPQEIRIIYKSVAHHAFLNNEKIVSVVHRAQLWTVVELVKTELAPELKRQCSLAGDKPRRSKKKNRRQRQLKKERQNQGEDDSDGDDESSEEEKLPAKGGKKGAPAGKQNKNVRKR